MGQIILKWIQFSIGAIGLLLSLALIVAEIVIGIKRKKLIKQIAGSDIFKLALSMDVVGFARMVIPIGILISISLVILKEDKVLGQVLLACFGLIAIVWLITRPNHLLIRIFEDKIFFIHWKSREINAIVGYTHLKDTDTIEIKYIDIMGREMEIECENTEENIRVIKHVIERLRLNGK